MEVDNYQLTFNFTIMDNTSKVITITTTCIGFINYLSNIHIASWFSRIGEAGFTAFLCGAMGMVGKHMVDFAKPRVIAYILRLKTPKK